MVAHTDTVHSSGPAQSKGDVGSLVELCPDAVRVLSDYSVAFRERRWRDMPEDLGAAAEEILSGYYRVIPEPQPRVALEVSIAFELASARVWALHALKHQHDLDKSVKQIELRIADDRPLAICVGGALITAPLMPKGSRRGWRLPVKPIEFQARVVVSHGRSHTLKGGGRLPYCGCLCVFPDTTQDQRHPWRYLCDDCHPRNGGRSKQQRKYSRQLSDWLNNRVAEAYGDSR